jgi:hypothetical protein
MTDPLWGNLPWAGLSHSRTVSRRNPPASGAAEDGEKPAKNYLSATDTLLALMGRFRLAENHVTK